MKKKVLAWVAAILIVALVSAAFLRPVDPNPHFGLVEDVYRYADGEALECVGDTHIFTVDEIQWSRAGSMLGVWFRATVAEGHIIAMTTKMYDRGEEISYGLDVPDIGYSAGIVEKLNGGEWEPYCDLSFPRMNTGASYWGYPPFDWHSAGEEYLHYQAPIHEPGEYRFTYYFRECSPAQGAYSTDGELYSVSHTLTVPEASDKPFDLVAPGLGLSTGFTAVAPLIRINDGSGIYFDRASPRLEVLEGGRWVEADALEGESSAVRSLVDEDSEYRYAVHAEQPRDLRSGDALETLLQLPMIQLYLDDPEADYRLTLEFAENEDGSGERYTLQLRLNFSREGME